MSTDSTDQRRHLLGLPEIVFDAAGQIIALQFDHTLIALVSIIAIDGERQTAAPQQGPGRAGGIFAFLQPDVATQVPAITIIADDQSRRTIAVCLQ